MTMRATRGAPRRRKCETPDATPEDLASALVAVRRARGAYLGAMRADATSSVLADLAEDLARAERVCLAVRTAAAA